MDTNQLTIPIKILDSGLTDCGLGLVVLRAAKLAQSKNTSKNNVTIKKLFITNYIRVRLKAI